MGAIDDAEADGDAWPPDLNDPLIGYVGLGGVKADADLVFYADESGNTGANYLDAAQPYYVAGGWLLKASDQEKARLSVRRTVRERKMAELSGPQLLRTKPGRKAALELVSSLVGFASPMLIVVEKRFALGVYLAMEFLDHTVNSAVSSPVAIDRPTSRTYATMLATLPRPILKIANAHLRGPSLEKAATCLEAVVPALREAGHDDLARLIANVDLNAGWKHVDPIRARGLSPNVMAFTTLMQSLEILGIQSSRPIALVHDESDQFHSSYDFYQRVGASQKPDGAYAEFYRAAGAPGVLSHVSRPIFRSSFTEPIIQAADVLVGLSVALLNRLRINGAWADDDEATLAVILLGGFFNIDLKKFFRFIGFHETGMCVGQAVVDTFKKISAND